MEENIKNILNNKLAKYNITPFIIKNNKKVINYQELCYNNSFNKVCLSTNMKDILNAWKNIDKNCENIFWYIFSNINENSNIIKFNIDDINNNYNKIIDNTKAIQHLIRPINNIIDNTNSIYLLAKTNIKNLYIINHNIIFKGDYNCFIDLSKEYNAVGNIMFDKNGNVYHSKITIKDNGFNIDIRTNN